MKREGGERKGGEMEGKGGKRENENRIRMERVEFSEEL